MQYSILLLYCSGDCEPEGTSDWLMAHGIASDPEQEVKSPAELDTMLYALSKSIPGRRIKRSTNEFAILTLSLKVGHVFNNTGWFDFLTPQVAIDWILGMEIIETLQIRRIWSGICCWHPPNPISSWASRVQTENHLPVWRLFSLEGLFKHECCLNWQLTQA